MRLVLLMQSHSISDFLQGSPRLRQFHSHLVLHTITQVKRASLPPQTVQPCSRIRLTLLISRSIIQPLEERPEMKRLQLHTRFASLPVRHGGNELHIIVVVELMQVFHFGWVVLGEHGRLIQPGGGDVQEIAGAVAVQGIGVGDLRVDDGVDECLVFALRPRVSYVVVADVDDENRVRIPACYACFWVGRVGGCRRGGALGLVFRVEVLLDLILSAGWVVPREVGIGVVLGDRARDGEVVGVQDRFIVLYGQVVDVAVAVGECAGYEKGKYVSRRDEDIQIG
jgi:hypothetical protein